jgi:aromatic ring-opening dioxygenase LigB subunit
VIVFAAIAPHGDLVLGDEPAAPATRAALEELGRRHAAARPEVTIVVTPHNVHVAGHFAVVTAGRVGEHDVDRDLAETILAALDPLRIPVVGLSYGGNDPAHAEMPIDWGTEIPLEFIRGTPVVVVSPARDRPLADHVDAGRAIAVASEGRRTTLVASADHGHAHDPDGPYGFDPAAAEYDEEVQRMVRENRLVELLGLGDLAERGKADSLWQMLVLYGALGDECRAELLSYEAPTYYGMLCAAFEPTDDRLGSRK